MTNKSGVWGSLERWRSAVFLVAGGCFLLVAVNFGTRVTANMGVDVPAWAVQLLVLLVLVGLLGLSPRLRNHAPRSARLGQVLALILGAEIVLPLGVALATPVSLPQAIYAVIIVTMMIGTVLTVTLFGITSLWTRAYSRPVGGFLLLAAAGLFIAIGGRIIFGDPGPEWIGAVANGTFGISMLAVGYVLRAEGSPTEPPDSTETVA